MLSAPVISVRTFRWLASALTLALCVFLSQLAEAQQTKHKALIVDGQNNHKNWSETTQMMKSYLEDSGMFEVDIARTADKGTDEEFSPNFADYKLVVSNYNGAEWPEATKTAFVEFVKEGGGFITVHAADNSFPKWKEYNEMIGLGGWGGRNQNDGPYVYYNEEKKQVVRDTSEGNGGHHGRQHPFRVIIRDGDHPITKGMPGAWMHVQDELYDKLRGPANNMKILGTAFADPKTGGSGRHEPMLFTIDYGQGRVFHIPMGHSNESQQCVGFITTFLRGAEWAATGEVTQEIPKDFPTMDDVKTREFEFSK